MKIIHRLLCDAPLISDGALAALLDSIQSTGPLMAEHPGVVKLRELLKPKLEIKDTSEGKVAIIPIQGVLAHNPDPFEMLYSGVEDSRSVLRMIEDSDADNSIAGVMLDFDSPGGFYTGGPACADAVAACAKTKPTFAFVGGSMSSLAYWIGSQASKIIASRDASVGSIGAYMTHTDRSHMAHEAGLKVEVIRNKEADFKAIGIPGTSLTDGQRAHLQERIQALFYEFRDSVKAARPQVSDDSMRGQSFTGQEAKKLGLVDYTGNRSLALGLLCGDMKKRAN